MFIFLVIEKYFLVIEIFFFVIYREIPVLKYNNIQRIVIKISYLTFDTFFFREAF